MKAKKLKPPAGDTIRDRVRRCMILGRHGDPWITTFNNDGTERTPHCWNCSAPRGWKP
jgi:hypothetical protein